MAKMTKYYVVLTGDLRIGAVAKDYPMSDTPMQVDLPEDFNIRRSMDYRLVDGVVIHDPLPAPAPVPSETDLLTAAVVDLQYQIIMLGLGALPLP